jgi:DNA-binding transcriptional regulator YiaG
MNNHDSVWRVDYGSAFSSNIYSKLFLTEEEAKDFYDQEDAVYKNMYQTRDIWNWREKEIARRSRRKDGDERTNLKRIREAVGLTQSQLSEASGVNVRMIQYYEQGFKDINGASALTVYRLAEALGTTVGELLEIKK